MSQSHIEWLQDTTKCDLTATQQDMLNRGLIYQLGRDRQGRPLIYINLGVYNSDKDTDQDFLKVLCFVFRHVWEYMFIPGKVENWIILIDIADRGIFGFPTQILKSIITETRPKFPNGLEKLWIVNPSSSLNLSWSAISNILDENTNKKIGFVPKGEFKKLFETIAPDQLQEKYGGSLDNLTTYWPPLVTYQSDDDLKRQFAKYEKYDGDPLAETRAQLSSGEKSIQNQPSRFATNKTLQKSMNPQNQQQNVNYPTPKMAATLSYIQENEENIQTGGVCGYKLTNKNIKDEDEICTLI